MRASILVVGDEILGGFVRDTNSGWLAARLHTLGVPLDRVVVVPDDLAAIDEALSTELGRSRPRLLLTSGGIGSTPDDVTIEAVAASLDRGLCIEPQIDRRISLVLHQTAAQGVTITAEHERAMRKLALVPKGAWLLTSADGIAPGIVVDVEGGCRHEGGATVVILPGIPKELQQIMRQGIEPTLLKGRGAPLHVAEARHGYPESTLGPMFDRLAAEFPDVHVGSYPDRECLIRLKGSVDRVELAMRVVRDFLADLDADPSNQWLRTAWSAHWQ
jgi:molybdenum cofactor synthesis domain-containing protein